MISNPKCGWCKFHIENFKGNPSYLTDVPMDLLDAFVEYFCDRKFSGCINFDEEGSEFNLVLTSNGAYIIEEKDEAKLIVVDSSVRELAEELIDDISSNFEGWAKEFSVEIGLSRNKNRDKEIINERITMFKSKVQLLKDTFNAYDTKRSEEILREKQEEDVKYDKNDYLIIEGNIEK